MVSIKEYNILSKHYADPLFFCENCGSHFYFEPNKKKKYETLEDEMNDLHRLDGKLRLRREGDMCRCLLYKEQLTWE